MIELSAMLVLLALVAALVYWLHSLSRKTRKQTYANAAFIVSSLASVGSLFLVSSGLMAPRVSSVVLVYVSLAFFVVQALVSLQTIRSTPRRRPLP